MVSPGGSGVAAPDGAALAGDDRQRLARDLHDEIGSLALLKLYLAQTAADLKEGRTRQAGRRLDATTALVAETIESVRRVILDLGPPVLDERGLSEAVRIATRRFAEATGIRVHLRESGLPDHLPSEHQTALYRVLQGALSNVLRHAQADNLGVTLAGAPGPAVVLTVEDDGLGFPVHGKVSPLSLGLAGMRERTEALGGRLTVKSWPARGGRRRRGTRIEASLPLAPGYRM